MKLSPVREKTFFFFEDRNSLLRIFECCDSCVAVLNADQIDQWFNQFEKIASEDNAAEYCDFGSTSVVFDIAGQMLTVVSDSGGELATGEFEMFCDKLGIKSQFIIDSLDCTDVEVEDIYTGAGDDDVELLGLVHKVFN